YPCSCTSWTAEILNSRVYLRLLMDVSFLGLHCIPPERPLFLGRVTPRPSPLVPHPYSIAPRSYSPSSARFMKSAPCARASPSFDGSLPPACAMSGRPPPP